MATATSVTRKVKDITLTLTQEEANILMLVLSSVAGGAGVEYGNRPERETTSELYYALGEVVGKPTWSEQRALFGDSTLVMLPAPGRRSAF